MIPIGTYIQFEPPSGGSTPYAFQNFHPGETRSLAGVNYTYAGYGFSGTSVDLKGSNIRAALVFGVSELLLSFIQEAADSRWIVRIKAVWLDPDTLVETGTFTEEVYQIVSYGHNGSRLSLELGSPLDAVTAQVPRRVLTQELVGSLPTTGQISFV
jgi:hypothetical protein